MAVVVSDPGTTRPSIQWAPRQRGLKVRTLRQSIPLSVRSDIDRAVVDPILPGLDCPRSMIRDLHNLLVRPHVRQWVLSLDQCSQDLWAAIVSDYMEQAWRRQPDLAGRYIQWLLPTVAEVIRSVSGMVRLEWDADFREALAVRGDAQIQLELLGPLAVFFLQSLARGEAAWDTLVEPEQVPPRLLPFGWAPLADGLRPTMRFLITGQCGETFKRKAFLYSPLSIYLQSLGVAERVLTLRHVCPTCREAWLGSSCPSCGSDLINQSSPWLLAKAYLQRCQGRFDDEGRRLVLLGSLVQVDPAGLDSHCDLRTGRSHVLPEDMAERHYWNNLMRQQALAMVQEFLGDGKTHVKQLALCAELAGVADPRRLLEEMASPDDATPLERLIETLLEPRIADRAERVERMNRRLPVIAISLGAEHWTAFTEIQFGVYLGRLREQFLRPFKGQAESLAKL